MTATRIVRPIWRRFRPRWLARAAAHVRAGGCAAIVDEKNNVQVLLPVDKKGKLPELARWALLAIEHRRTTRVLEGPAKGLATIRIKSHYAGSVLDWCTRDSIHEGTTRRFELDCLACGACCHDSNVILDDVDLDRFRKAGREDLTTSKHIVRHKDGRISLRFAKPGPCQLQAADNRCTIYEIRPDNCRRFVAGSEACLAAREDTLHLRDGAPSDEVVEVIDLRP
ncbi:MAG TPA: YkgJ family cysteine cluster protein [Polyangium sp.]|nr:YkgJ family cysteine cluster protein [Polyangium sp.]